MVREQALRCNFESYNVDTATRDAILFQTSDAKLQREILSKDLNMDATIKAGLAFEQSKMKQENISVTKQTEDDVRALSIKKKKKAVRVDCETCTQPTHGEGDCPAKESECFGCGRTGHFKGSKACKKKKGSKDDDKKRKKS